MRHVLVALAVCLALAGCTADRPVTGLRVMVPNNPGSGFDVTARSAALAMEDAGLARNVEVFNLPGAFGTVGLQRLVNERGNGGLLMQMGLGVVGAVHTARSPVSFADTTPIAKLTEDAEAVVVAVDAPYGTLDELTTAWRADPGRMPVGGGSSPGGPDHLAAHLLAQAVGLDPGRVDYREYGGGGDVLAAVLGHRVAFGVSSPTEVRDQILAGQVRVLAVTSAARVPGVDAPTLREAGVDLQFANWRGLVAPPGLTDSDRQALMQLVDAMRGSPEWAQALARMNVTDSYLTGDAFGAFLRAEDERVTAVLQRLDL
jgi:putative tricarboxylic transport membrane protein